MTTLPPIAKPDTMTDKEIMGAILALTVMGGSGETLARLKTEAKRRFQKGGSSE